MSPQMDTTQRYLSRKDVELACEEIDSVALMHEVFTLHGKGQTFLPDEAYLAWTNEHGESLRNLNMPGYVGGSLDVAGTKSINSNIANPTRGLPRASGLTLLFDTTSAYILCVMEGAFISSLRTASVSMLAAEVLRGRTIQDVALIGAGVLAHAHIRLLLKRRARFPDLRCIHIFDLDAGRVSALQKNVAAVAAASGIEVHIAASAEEAIRAAQLIIPVTTTTTGHIRFDWLQPGACLVNISLDDPLPEIVLKADRIIVDDWSLVKDDSRRLLGRMWRSPHASTRRRSHANLAYR